MPVTEIDLETPEQSLGAEKQKTTEPTPMPNLEEQGTQTIEFSPIGNGDEVTNNTPGTIKNDSQTKRTSFTSKLAAMVGMKPTEKEEMTTTSEKGKTFGTVSTLTTEADQGKDQRVEGAVGHQNGQAAESKLPLVELGEMMSKLEQRDKKLKCSEEDSQQLRKELRHNKNDI